MLVYSFISIICTGTTYNKTIDAAMNATNDYKEDDGFEYYETYTRDTGPWMLVGVCMYSMICVLVLLTLVSFGKRWKRKRAHVEHSIVDSQRAEDVDTINEEADCCLGVEVEVEIVGCEIFQQSGRIDGGKYSNGKYVHVSYENELDVPALPDKNQSASINRKSGNDLNQSTVPSISRKKSPKKQNNTEEGKYSYVPDKDIERNCQIDDEISVSTPTSESQASIV